VYPLLCLQVTIIGLRGSFCFLHFAEGVDPPFLVGILLQRDRRTERKQLIRLYYEHSWVIGSQVQREFDITRCLQNNSLLHV
jgi:hypothetical protein